MSLVWLVMFLARAGVWSVVEDRRAAPEAFRTLDAAERAAISELARTLVHAAPSGVLPHALTTRAEEAGWSIQSEDGIAILAEAGPPTGAGLLAVRLGPVRSELVLQAPHPWFDLHTGRIVAAMFEESEVGRAVVIATVHRRAAEHSDATHNATLGFQALTQGASEGVPTPLFVQIHGFGAETSDAEAVVSAGTSWIGPTLLDDTRERIGRTLGLVNVHTGEAVPALAARTNVQGRLLSGNTRFLHIELAIATRLRLRDEPALRAALSEDLAELAASP